MLKSEICMQLARLDLRQLLIDFLVGQPWVVGRSI